MTLAELDKKADAIIKEYAAKGYSMIGEPHKTSCELYNMTTYSVSTADHKRLHIVATLWHVPYYLDEWSISVYDPEMGKKPISRICGK